MQEKLKISGCCTKRVNMYVWFIETSYYSCRYIFNDARGGTQSIKDVNTTAETWGHQLFNASKLANIFLCNKVKCK